MSALDEAVRYFETFDGERAFAARRLGGKDPVIRFILEAVGDCVRLEIRPPQAAAIAALIRDGAAELAAGRIIEAKKLASEAERLRRAVPEDPNLPRALAIKAALGHLSDAAEALQQAADKAAEKLA